VIRSSEIPSETYCWAASPLSFASGSTAMEAAFGAFSFGRLSRSIPRYPSAKSTATAIAPYHTPIRRRVDPRPAGARLVPALPVEWARGSWGAISPDNKRWTRSTKAGGVSPPARRVHCSSRKRSGTCSSSSGESSITTGSRNAFVAVMRWERSTASFHSSRKYPSARSCVWRETTGMNSAQFLICRRID